MLEMQTFHKKDELTNEGVLIALRSAVFMAIAKYKAERKKIPADRADLINQIKMIISEDSAGIEQIKSDIRDALHHIRTGWWIFKTGRSKLKRNILRVVNDCVFELDGIGAEMVLFHPLALQSQSDMDTDSEMSLLLEDENAEIERLGLALSKSQREVYSLQSQLHACVDENKELRKEVIALQRRLGMTQGVSQHSPSADITGSFSALEM